MSAKSQAQSLYYQTIAREFFRLRGAPFFLSPKDVALIERWETMKVPLDAVLEGLSRAFENYRKGGRSAKALTLAFCEYQVMKASVQQAERKTGKAGRSVSRSEKVERLKRETRNFLEAVPPGLEGLRPIFEKAAALLRVQEINEADLEKADDEADEALWQAASAEEKEEIRRQVVEEFAGKRSLNLQEVWRTRLVKIRRDRHKVPYFSLYYY